MTNPCIHKLLPCTVLFVIEIKLIYSVTVGCFRMHFLLLAFGKFSPH